MTIGTTHASDCHRAAAYERPACLATPAKPAPAKASGYPEYLMRQYSGVWCETL